jgi:rhodanese-related sulfurtransferase
MSQIKNVDSQTLNKWMKANKVLLIDVREPLEYKIERIKFSQNIPLAQINLKSLGLTTNKKIVIQCRSGIRSISACKKLLENNPALELYNLDGGILDWKAKGYDVI